MSGRLKRRTFLGSMGTLGALGALGAVGASTLAPRPCRAAGSPKRLVIFTTPNNWMGRDAWTPEGSGSSRALTGALPSLLAPMEHHRDKLLLLGNLRNHCHVPDVSQQNSHAGMGHMLTGRRNLVWADESNENNYWGGGQSVDQFIADRLGTPALTLGVRCRGTSGGSRISYTAANTPVSPIEDPGETYARYFGGGESAPSERENRDARRRAILDLVGGRLSRLQDRYGAAEASRVERHLDSLATVRDRLASGVGASCNPAAPAEGGNYPHVIMRQAELLVEALACGQTQVASLQCGNTGGAESYSGGLSWGAVPELGLDSVSHSRSQHVIAHDYDGDQSTDNRRAREDVERVYSTLFAYLLDLMDSVPEEDGTLLDNSVVLYAKPMGYRHSPSRMLYVLAGGAGGQLATGRFEDHEDVPHNDLLVSLCRLMGQTDVTSFGDPEICTGDLLGV